jgi:Tfp pilus assembly protein PilZ
MENKRKHIRHPITKLAEVVVKDRRYFGLVLNLTEGGSFISTHGPFSIGDAITVTYQLDDGPIGKVRRTGTIKWITGKGILTIAATREVFYQKPGRSTKMASKRGIHMQKTAF